MKTIDTYFGESMRLLEEVLTSQRGPIEQAVEAVVNALSKGGTLFAFGTGHSHMLAEELFYRAGGLVKVRPLFDEPLMLHAGASRSSQIERLAGYAKTILDNGVNMKEGDVLFVFSNSGRNAVPVDMALEAKKRGAVVVCITNLTHSSHETSRHPSGLKLYEASDIVIDNCGCLGDAAVEIGQYKCGPTSTVVGAAILQAIVCGTVETMLARGEDPEVFCSSNIDGGDAKNAGFLTKYRAEIPML